MTFGFFAKGDAANLIIDADNPPLVQVEAGEIRLTERITSVNGGVTAYGACTVTYRTPRRTKQPPLVFGVPSAAGAQGGGIGYFGHTGYAGNWTGFKVVFTPNLRFGGGAVGAVGLHTGWNYRVCEFFAPPGVDRYGMRIWDSNGDVVFDSGWPLVPFRSLMRNWASAGARKTGRSNYIFYWGNIGYNPNKDCDGTYELFTHPWGASDGNLGVLISQLRAMTFYGDDGYEDYREMVSAPVVGFLDGSRTSIYASIPYGILQHAGSSIAAMNNFALLTADFSRT